MLRKGYLSAIAIAGIAVLCASFQVPAGAILVGSSPGGPSVTTIVDVDATPAQGMAASWTLGSEQNAIAIDFLAEAGLWLKQLDDSPTVQPGATFQLREFIEVGTGSASWVSWSQGFVTEGFSFGNAELFVNGDLLTTGLLNAAGDIVEFDFSPLAAGTVIEIVKIFTWNGTAPSFNNAWPGNDFIEIEQFPGVESGEPVIPEPATLSLLGIGGSLLGMVGWRNRRRK